MSGQDLLAKVGGYPGAAAIVGVGTVLGMAYTLASMSSAAEFTDENGNMSIDDWCEKNKLEKDLSIDGVASSAATIKKLVDKALDSKAQIFKRMYKGPDRYTEFSKDIAREMSHYEWCMKKAQACSFFSGLAKTQRIPFTFTPNLDWKYQKYRELCGGA